MFDEFLPLNDDWTHNFEKTDNLYKDFYKDDVYYVNVKVIYVNKTNEISNVISEPLLIKYPNKISREEIIQILKKRSINNGTRYSLLSILRYNIHLDPKNVKQFLLDKESQNYLTVIKNIDTIVYEKTIHAFQDLNDLILIYYEKTEPVIKSSFQSTKKIRLHFLNTNKKTLRKLI
jgi:hypothetical protein